MEQPVLGMKTLITVIAAIAAALTISATFITTAAGGQGAPASEITIRARGVVGNENLALQLNGTTIATFNSIGTTNRTLTHTVTQPATINQLRVAFTNNAAGGDAIIDHITIGGQRFETEAANVYSKGIWTNATGCAEGFKRNERIACGGWVEYRAANGITIGNAAPPPPQDATSQITIRARGVGGSENIALQLNNTTIATFNSIGTSFRTFTHTIEDPTTIDRLRVAFTNNAPGRDAVIDYITVDEHRFETEAADVYSKGIWNAATGCANGYKQSQTIACGGWVEYRAANGIALVGGNDPAPEPWNLVWSDEFTGDTLDTTKWAGFAGNYGTPERLQVYRTEPENLRVEDGRLILRATRDDANNAWNSGMVHTNDVRQPNNPAWAKGNLGWQNGKFEVRAKLPYGRGMWPAIWMRPIDNKYGGGWPNNGEIDILEYLGPQADKPGEPIESLIQNIHYLDTNANRRQDRNAVPVTRDFAESWHVYGLEWEEDVMRFYVDGELVHTVSSGPSNHGWPAPFDQRFDIIINVQIGYWAGEPNAADYPGQMEVDWVRVYEAA